MIKDIRLILFCLLVLICIGVFIACTSVSKSNAKPIKNFEIERYLGDWYEIARLDFKWEKNLKNVRANYSMDENGTINVKNSGYDYVSKKEKHSTGKAKFATKQKDIASLKVSFFGPFYSSYTVIALDSEYKYALIAEKNKNLLWILSRTPTIPDNIKKEYVQIAQSEGYDLTDFIWTIQE